MDIPGIEKKILEFWQKNKIFEKSLNKKPGPRSRGRGKDFVFYDGPPFATGTPHYGHIVASLMKDIVPRYWTMQGYRVERKWGWDCHGLPIENIVEAEMGLKNKKDIEKVGIEKFNQTCQSKVLIYAQEWKKVVDRLGRWVDMENAYKTMDLSFMESVWWVFKQLWDKELIYLGYKSMHICPRCETTLSQSEVSQEYQDIEDISVIAKFELIAEPKTYILAWTTTPWTLPGNVALAMGKDLDYVKVKSDDGNYILVEQNLDSIFGDKKHEIIARVKAEDLEGKKYKPLFDYFLDKELENKDNFYTVQLADFITVEDGTGIVHIAPAFGEDDMNLGKEKNLPFIQHLRMNGQITDEVTDFKGLEVKSKDNPQSTDKKIIDYLKKKNLVFKTEKFMHSYPFCWRCGSPLLNYAASSWFVNVTKLKDKMLKYARNINWVPEHIKEGRFGKWLEGAKDWSISRQRFWGSVLPIWVCDKCKEKKVIGSIKELEELSGAKITDLHKHFVDKVTLKCKCGGKMKRVSDVLDCWFESGSMPYGQMHYPFENKEKFDKNFPAKFIAEGADQTRCWFYYLHVLSTAVKNSEAFKNVVVNGIVLAEDGKKMSKKLNNYPDPMEVFEKYGADAVRYYFATSPVMKTEDLCFSEKAVSEVVKRVMLILLNVFSFYKMFELGVKESSKSKNILDRWILSRTESLKKEITDGYDNYDINKATVPIEAFVNDLSTWYLRRSRERFKGDNKRDKENAVKTSKYVLLELSKLMAPVMPFVSEYIYKELDREKESVHLEDWPKVNKKLIDKKLEEKMQKVRDICSAVLQKRAEEGIKVRQPLAEIKIKLKKGVIDEQLTELIKDEVNVKGVAFDSKIKEEVILDTQITPQLEEEGMVREFIRQVQAERKKAGLTPKDKINVYFSDEKLRKIVEKNKEKIKKQVIAEDIEFGNEFKIEKIHD
ncbi:MAG: isoleucine--tRNA ligase [Candidatus Portnoybacteria bacterium CG10_big_fil_rev_8_21_14_0_10_38_18]|uniref:Isoleucine--tRNA ligase n=1 Tax=Candidatus Portnoybacteria bacterium CG10_big_fil_rev_8_21_14_0_10_38_18 TaxID=1974813 RepID=A0A2M8KC96_9BACT|nr:MAG: isoleucine--tRNA ligase [Candidatus Portnoybacteria bacterium CG10_big_fil_rev_8_21_14_0_10_38_18]